MDDYSVENMFLYIDGDNIGKWEFDIFIDYESIF